ncbi:MAG: metallophosphoesterase family protein [Promethearchaeia archaeon]
MSSLDLSKGIYPIIVKPNLGYPEILNLKDYIDQNDNLLGNIRFTAFIIANPDQSVQEILEFFYSNLYYQPIMRERGPFLERRGDRYPLHIKEIVEIKKLDFRDQPVLSKENCIIWDMYNTMLQIEDVFGNRTKLYKLSLKVKKVKQIQQLFKQTGQNLLLCDIVHDIPNRIEDKINFHSLALFNKDMRDFHFIHSTDFHIARRHDFIAHFLKEKVRNRLQRYKNKKNKLAKIDKTILKRDFKYEEGIEKERFEKLRFAKYNFNYNLRKFIAFVNERVKRNKLDFVLCGGDLIDYLEIARGNYQYENNFHVLLDILLGRNRGLDKYPYINDEEFINDREILAPIFTMVGNHDYRKGHYSITLGKVRKIFGLTKEDVKGYHDFKFFNYFTALRSRDKYLRDYFRYFNPNLNYKFQFGENCHFIFIDTGQDSVADMHDLLKGSPSTKGLKNYQIDLLRSFVKLAKDGKIVVVTHTPPISPSLGRIKRWRFKRKFNLKRKLKWSDFYEHNLKEYIGDPRLEKILNLKYQTIMYNWGDLLKIFIGADKEIRRKVDLIFCGHTHTLKEFRLKETQDTESINMGFYIAPIYIEIPCHVYTSKYREKFKQFKDNLERKIWFDVKKPFIFQTQAVGPISLNYKFKPPGFRLLSFEDYQLIDNKVYSLRLKDSISEKDKNILYNLGLSIKDL